MGKQEESQAGIIPQVKNTATKNFCSLLLLVLNYFNSFYLAKIYSGTIVCWAQR